jgi:hypothetical protein
MHVLAIGAERHDHREACGVAAAAAAPMGSAAAGTGRKSHASAPSRIGNEICLEMHGMGQGLIHRTSPPDAARWATPHTKATTVNRSRSASAIHRIDGDIE